MYRCSNFSTSDNDTKSGEDSQDDFFKRLTSAPDDHDSNIVKVDDIRRNDDGSILQGQPYQEQYDYEGRLADRATEEDFEVENLMMYDQKFADKVRIYCKGGTGGNGCVSYYRENYGFKVPDGGCGGDGGDVYFQSTTRLQNLYELRRAHFKGNQGKAGKSQKSNGTHARDVHFSVPLGTEVYEVKRSTGSKKQARASRVTGAGRDEVKIKIGDLDSEDQTIRMAQGGKGGLGNNKDKQLKIMIHGQEGEEKEYELRLKVIADIGFIGYPNAGKSTLLSALTRAFPKIAHYPFTTLRPYIGQVKFVDDSKLILADLPGIIQGAHENKGLGHEFLQHAERTKVLLYVVDGTIVDDNRTPLKDFNVLQEELRLYKGGILL